MRTKALLIGALPAPFEGPWVPIRDGESWRVSSIPEEFRGKVAVETAEEGLSALDRFLLDGSPTIVDGHYARAVVLEEFEGPSITLSIREEKVVG